MKNINLQANENHPRIMSHRPTTDELDLDNTAKLGGK